jgi:PAS domain S-box-containing protein
MAETPPSRELSWRALPRAAKTYVGIVIAAGAASALTFLPDRIEHAGLFVLMLGFSYLTSTWKVNLPLALNNGSTLSVSYAADLMSLLLLGPRQALLIAMAGAWAQCSTQPKRTYPTYRTLFSVAVLAITMRAVAAVYLRLHDMAPFVTGSDLTRPLLGMIATYFVVNTALVAVAIALATRQAIWPVWRDNFLWSAPSFMVAGGAGALAAFVVARGDYWLAPLMAAPVYLTYRTYRVFLGRIEDARRHAEESRRMHQETVDALMEAQAAKRALAAEKERLAVTLRSIGDGVIAADANGRVRLMNQAAEILTGWSQEEALGAPINDIFTTLDPDTRAPYDNGSVTGANRPAGVARSVILIPRGRSEVAVQDVWAPLGGDGGEPIGVVIAFRDASDAVRTQEERAKASKLESLGLLAGGIAHDFNNILTAILGNVSLSRALIAANPQADAALAEAEQACVRARQLTQQLLTFSKGGRPVKKPLHLDRVVKESIRLALSGSPVGWTARIDRDLWPVNADEGQLTQVFNNILINAHQAMPRGGQIVIAGRNCTETEERWEFGMKVMPGPYVRISVTDEGVGIPPESLGRIFEPYFSTKSTGSGLGLATSQSIVKNHGGFLAVDSEPGRGTTMHVSLPAAVSERVPIEHAAVPLTSARHGGGRVLVLDDEEAIRTLAAQLLRMLGYDVETVSTGEAAIARYVSARNEGQAFDIVLLDLTIPGGMGGGQVIQSLLAIDPGVRAIVVSGYASDALLSRYREHGFKAAVTKPFTIRELTAALDELSGTRA